MNAAATTATNDNAPKALPNTLAPDLFRRDLPCKLTDSEAIRYGAMLSNKVRERDMLDEQRKSVAAEYSSKIKSLTTEISRVAFALDKGEELRSIDCYREFRDGVMHTIRTDTGATVEVRPATIADRQAELPGPNGTTIAPSHTDFPDIEDGPKGDDLAAAPTTGEMVTSSVGDQVFHQPDDPGDKDDGDGTFAELDDEETHDGERKPAKATVVEGDDDLDADLDAAYDERTRQKDDNDAAAASAEIVHQKKRGPKGPRKNKAAAATEASALATIPQCASTYDGKRCALGEGHTAQHESESGASWPNAPKGGKKRK